MAVLAALWRWTAGGRRGLCAHTRITSGVDGAPESARQLLDAEIEKNDDMGRGVLVQYDVCYANSCMNGT